MIENIEAWILLLTALAGLITTCIQLYRKAREANDLKEIVNVLAGGIEEVDQKYKEVEKPLYKVLGRVNRNYMGDRVKAASGQEIKKKARVRLGHRASKRFDKILAGLGIGPKAKTGGNK